jgi:hypothetical protein
MGNFPRALSLLASGLLATVLILAHPGFALAQDANDADVSEQPEVTVPNISGCWQGNAFSNAQGNSGILFVFVQKKNKINKKGSTVGLQGGTTVQGKIAGSVKSTQFTFRGRVANGCNITGIGFLQSDGTYDGNYHYTGKCSEHGFTTGDFSEVTFLGATCP